MQLVEEALAGKVHQPSGTNRLDDAMIDTANRVARDSAEFAQSPEDTRMLVHLGADDLTRSMWYYDPDINLNRKKYIPLTDVRDRQINARHFGELDYSDPKALDELLNTWDGLDDDIGRVNMAEPNVELGAISEAIGTGIIAMAEEYSGEVEFTEDDRLDMAEFVNAVVEVAVAVEQGDSNLGDAGAVVEDFLANNPELADVAAQVGAALLSGDAGDGAEGGPPPDDGGESEPPPEEEPPDEE